MARSGTSGPAQLAARAGPGGRAARGAHQHGSIAIQGEREQRRDTAPRPGDGERSPSCPQLAVPPASRAGKAGAAVPDLWGAAVPWFGDVGAVQSPGALLLHRTQMHGCPPPQGWQTQLQGSLRARTATLLVSVASASLVLQREDPLPKPGPRCCCWQGLSPVPALLWHLP